MNNKIIKNITIKRAKEENAHQIHNVLSNAFSQYIQYYTNDAYQSTVASPQVLKRRIRNRKITVLVAIYNNKIIGTASFQKKSEFIYLYSMAVDPAFQNNGVGNFLLDDIIKLTISKKFKKISIDSFHPLKDAIHFYESNGFKKTGVTKDYHGIEVFEMIKEIES
jgi:ribosomal protein S18 acetylase RimI-like enzyme